MGFIQKFLIVVLFLFSFSIWGSGCTGEGGTEAGNPGPEIVNGSPLEQPEPDPKPSGGEEIPTVQDEPQVGPAAPSTDEESDLEKSNEAENKREDF